MSIENRDWYREDYKKNAELCSEIDHLKDAVTALKQAAKNKGAK